MWAFSFCNRGFRRGSAVSGDNHFDALLLDNWMPGLTGLELCKIIRSFDHKIPIFFCSGAFTEADKEAALSAGAQGYISKPFDPDELTAILRFALNLVQP